MKEVPSGSTPSTFTASQPPKREAGVDSKFAAHAGILDAAKAIVQDLQVQVLGHQLEWSHNLIAPRAKYGARTLPLR